MSPITGDTAILKKADNSIPNWSKDGADLKWAISIKKGKKKEYLESTPEK